MSNFFVGLAVFLITIISSLFAIPYFVDWNSYRSVFEDEATQFLGREVRVGGAVNLHLLPTPYFRLEKVRIADTSGGLQEPFFRADSLALKLSIAPLLRGVVEANEIEFERPVLRLARDAKGVWNWQSIGQAFAGAAYLPANIALASLRITDATLAIHGQGGAERVRFEGINGELSAPAINGPYRFRGTLGAGNSEREIRIATTQPDAESAVRFRASVRFLDSGSLYVVDARLRDLMAEPRLEGELSARLPVAGLLGGAVSGRSGQDNRGGRAAEAAFEVKAQLKADVAGATFGDLAISFEQDGRPQLIAGEAKVGWEDSFSLDVMVASRWLDLDRITGADGSVGPAENIVPFVVRAGDLLPKDGRTRVGLFVDQANLGGEPISNMQLIVDRTQGRLEIEQLRAGMPGGSRIELQGVIAGRGDATAFQGDIGLRGTSLLRFLTWATGKPPPAPETKGDGAFGVHCEVTVVSGHATAKDIVGEMLGTPVFGQADWRWGQKPELTVRVEAPQVDLRALIPAGASLRDILSDIVGVAWKSSPSVSASESGRRGAEPQSGQLDLRLSLDADQVVTATNTYRDVAVQLRSRAGNVELPILRLSNDGGLVVDLKGQIENAMTRAKGSLDGVVAAGSAAELASLFELLGVPPSLRPDTRTAEVLSPLRVAGSVTLGARTATSVDLMLSGETRGSALKFNGRIDGAAAGWRAGPAELTGTLDGPDATNIAALLSDSLQSSPAAATTGHIFLKAKGVPAQALHSVASVAAGDLKLDFRGEVTVGETGNSIAGELDVKAADGQRLAAFAGLAPPLRFAGAPIEGSLHLSAGDGAVKLERLALKVGGSEVRGAITLSQAGERRHIEAKIDIGEISVRSLLSPLLDQRLAAITGAAEAAISGRLDPWPEEPFDLTELDRIEGVVELGIQRLALSDGGGLARAKASIAIDGGKVTVRALEGETLGAGRGRITLGIAGAGAGGANVSGTFSLTNANVGALLPASSHAAGTEGRLDADLSFSGRGASPRNLLSALQGKGSVHLGGKLPGLWPGAIGYAAEQALKGDSARLGTVLKDALAQGLFADRIALPDRIDIELGEGQLRSKPIVIDTAEGRASGTAALNLQTLGFDSEWRLEQAVPKGDGTPSKVVLPAVSVSYRSSVQALATAAPRVDAEALERELSVRKMEHDVEELERLHSLDEARRRSEAERMRQELERSQPPVPTPISPAPIARPAAPG